MSSTSVCLSVCLSVTLLRLTQSVELFDNVFAPPNSLRLGQLVLKFWGRKFQGFLGDHVVVRQFSHR